MRYKPEHLHIFFPIAVNDPFLRRAHLVYKNPLWNAESFVLKDIPPGTDAFTGVDELPPVETAFFQSPCKETLPSCGRRQLFYYSHKVKKEEEERF